MALLIPRRQGDRWACPTLSVGSAESAEIVLGRTKELEIPASETSVSRKHATIRHEDGAYTLHAHKKAFYKKSRGRKIYPVASGDSYTLNEGDVVYLALKDEVPLYGFRFEHAATPNTSQFKRGAAEAGQASPEGLASPTKKAKGDAQDAEDAAEGPIFQGLSFVFWERAHTERAKQRAAENGAVIEEELTPGTTHVIVGASITRRKAASLLGQTEEEFDPPADVHFVIPEFVTSSLAAQRCLDVSDFLVSSCKSDHRAAKGGEIAEGKLDPKPDPSSLAKLALQSPPPSQKRLSSPDERSSDFEAPATGAGATPDADDTPLAERLQRRQALEASTQGGIGQGGVGCSKAAQAVGSSEVTGGASGVPWGAKGCWTEPWTEEEARETVTRLDNFWHRRDLTASSSAIRDEKFAEREAATARESDRSGSEEEAEPSQLLTCHPACAHCSTCIVEELKELHSRYGRAGPDFFRGRAADGAARKVGMLNFPLRNQRDVEDLELGPKTMAKVMEIVETGKLRANLAAAQDARTQTILKFAKVWGAAHATAIKWYSDGCRTLDDLRDRSDLSQQQMAGLKYFDDMEIRIPREEGAAIAKFVTDAALEVFGWDMDGDDAPHMRPMGSFLRGKPSSGDLDMLILPPKYDKRVPEQLLKTLLEALRTKGFVTEEMQRLALGHLARGDHSCTFLGFCRLPGYPLVRRLDIKIYPRRQLPFAVNYFTGSGSFNRALRYWASDSPAGKAAARKLVPNSSGLRLSDKGMGPFTWMGQGKDRDKEGCGLLMADITCETDIFSALGLAYVPPHLRMP